MTNLKEILHIIISECENGCTSFGATVRYFKRCYEEDIFSAEEVILVASICDFQHIRENSTLLFDYTKPNYE